jgi:hypothetical protein
MGNAGFDWNKWLPIIIGAGSSAAGALAGSSATQNALGISQEKLDQARKNVLTMLGGSAKSSAGAIQAGTDAAKAGQVAGLKATLPVAQWGYESSRADREASTNQAIAALQQTREAQTKRLNPYYNTGMNAMTSLSNWILGPNQKDYTTPTPQYGTVGSGSTKSTAGAFPKIDIDALLKGITGGGSATTPGAAPWDNPTPGVADGSGVPPADIQGAMGENSNRNADGSLKISGTASTVGKVMTGASIGALAGKGAGLILSKLAPNLVANAAGNATWLGTLATGPWGALIGAAAMGVQALVGHFTKLGKDKVSATKGIDLISKVYADDWVPAVKAGKLTEAQLQVALQASFNDWANLLPDDVHERSIDSQLYWFNKGLASDGFKFQLEVPGHTANVNAGKPGFDQAGNPQ